MPEYVRDALLRRDVMYAYLSRLDSPQNDYIGWIMRATRETIRDESEHGGVYMRMKWTKSHKLFS